VAEVAAAIAASASDPESLESESEVVLLVAADAAVFARYGSDPESDSVDLEVDRDLFLSVLSDDVSVLTEAELSDFVSKTGSA
jgi:hypothetical protein